MEWHEQTFEELQGAQEPEERRRILQQAVQGQEYHEWYQLECKEVPGWPGQVDTHTKGALAKEVSAFANAAGGLIVWGYAEESKRGEPKTVRAVPRPLRKVSEFAREIRRLGPECTEPAVHDIRTISVVTGPQDVGFAVTYVASSNSGPHRAIMGPDKVKQRYFQRHSERANVMHHWELEEMFARRPRPVLVPQVRVSGFGGAGGPSPTLTLKWDVWNVGRAMAFGYTLEVRARSFWWPLTRGANQSSVRPLDLDQDLGFKAEGIGPAQGGRPTRQDRYYLVDPFVPLGGKPLRSEDGHVALESMVFAWQKIQTALGGHTWGTLCFDWVTGAQDMRPQRGAIVLALNDVTGTAIGGQVAEGGQPFDIKAEPDVALFVRYYNPHNIETQEIRLSEWVEQLRTGEIVLPP